MLTLEACPVCWGPVRPTAHGPFCLSYMDLCGAPGHLRPRGYRAVTGDFVAVEEGGPGEVEVNPADVRFYRDSSGYADREVSAALRGLPPLRFVRTAGDERPRPAPDEVFLMSREIGTGRIARPDVWVGPFLRWTTDALNPDSGDRMLAHYAIRSMNPEAAAIVDAWRRDHDNGGRP